MTLQLSPKVVVDQQQAHKSRNAMPPQEKQQQPQEQDNNNDRMPSPPLHAKHVVVQLPLSSADDQHKEVEWMCDYVWNPFFASWMKTEERIMVVVINNGRIQLQVPASPYDWRHLFAQMGFEFETSTTTTATMPPPFLPLMEGSNGACAPLGGPPKPLRPCRYRKGSSSSKPPPPVKEMAALACAPIGGETTIAQPSPPPPLPISRGPNLSKKSNMAAKNTANTSSSTAATPSSTSTSSTTFYIPSMCCTSEVPAIRSIVRSQQPEWRDLQIWLPTRQVRMTYSQSQSLTDVVQIWEQQGFPATPVAGSTVHHSQQAVAGDDSSGSSSASCTLELVSRNQNETASDARQLLKSIPWHELEAPEKISSVTPEHHYQVQIGYTSGSSPTECQELVQDFVGLHTDHAYGCRLVLDSNHQESLTQQVFQRIQEEKDQEEEMRLFQQQQQQKSSRWCSWRQLKPWAVVVSGICWVLAMSFSLLPEHHTHVLSSTSSSSNMSNSTHPGWHAYLPPLFGILAVAFGFPPVAIKAARAVFVRRQWDANVLMSLATIGAMALQEWEEAASVAFLFALSEYMEARASRRAQIALDELLALQPETATLVHDNPRRQQQQVPASVVPVGCLVAVGPSEKIPCNAYVYAGASVVDESTLTGEAHPIPKSVGDAVQGGTWNVGSTELILHTTKSLQDSAVAQLIQLVQAASAQSTLIQNASPTEQLMDSFAAKYTPIVVGLATLCCTISWFFGPSVGRQWTLNGLILIVLACPCALTISTPVTYAAGLAALAQRGIIVKGGKHLEALGFVDTMILDKTGTLTKGEFSVLHLEWVPKSRVSRSTMLQYLAALQSRSKHPVAVALCQAVAAEHAVVPTEWTIQNHTLLPGEGVMATIQGKAVYTGNERLFRRLGLLESSSFVKPSWTAQAGCTIGYIGTREDGIFGVYSARDSIREEAPSVRQALQDDWNVEPLMCTGDSLVAASAVAEQIGLPASAVHAQLIPQDKLHFVGSRIQPLSSSPSFLWGRRRRLVAFVGDGVNDGPALSVADVGISMGGHGVAAVAMEMSDVTLMDCNLHKLVDLIATGRKAVTTIRENIALSLFSKVVVVALTFVGKMTLWGAILSDVGILLIVTLNGMKLLPATTEHGRRRGCRRYRLVGQEERDENDNDLDEAHSPSHSDDEEEVELQVGSKSKIPAPASPDSVALAEIV